LLKGRSGKIGEFDGFIKKKNSKIKTLTLEMTPTLQRMYFKIKSENKTTSNPPNAHKSPTKQSVKNFVSIILTNQKSLMFSSGLERPAQGLWFDLILHA